jgi:D-amino-acid dehydrogenase
MRVIVLGGGVVGVTTAYYLAKEGHEVVVVEKQRLLAQDASSGNAGLIAPGHSYSWASPAAPRMLMRSLTGKATAIRVRPRFDPPLVNWGLRFLRECRRPRAEANTLVKLRLCRYSRELLRELLDDEGIDLGNSAEGVLYIYREAEELDIAYMKSELLRKNGEHQEVIDPDTVIELEPALAPAREEIAGAVLDPADFSGDCERFTFELADRCRDLGVDFRLATAVHRLASDGDRITGAVCDGATLTGDAYVLSLGCDSPAIAKTIGRRLPIYPAKGYSATFPIDDRHQPPQMGGVDELTLVAWANFGDRLRMSSTAEFVGHSRSWTDRDFHNIFEMAAAILPNAADYSRGEFRACLRPMTPGGPPIIGRDRRYGNLIYNTGQGHMGWTMACGSARVAIDAIAERRPEIETAGIAVPA